MSIFEVCRDKSLTSIQKKSEPIEPKNLVFVHCAYSFRTAIHMSCMGFGILFFFFFFWKSRISERPFAQLIIFIIQTSEETKDYFKAWAHLHLDIIEQGIVTKSTRYSHMHLNRLHIKCKPLNIVKLLSSGTLYNKQYRETPYMILSTGLNNE